MSLLELARRTAFYVQGLDDLASQLPDDDQALNTALRDSAVAGDARAFEPMLAASLCTGRKVDGRCLGHGAPLLRSGTELARAVVLAEGDVGGALIEALRTERLRREKAVYGIVLGAWWAKEHGQSERLEEFAGLARPLARNPPDFPPSLLLALLDLTDDENLSSVLKRRFNEDDRELARLHFAWLVGRFEDDPWYGIPKEPPPLAGYTVRRAVARIGRNEPCPCGSGKKYKKCCEAKDRERLRRSSPVAGVTTDELWSHPEPHLTLDMVHTMPAHDLFRLRAEEIAPDLHAAVASRLVSEGTPEVTVRFFEAIGYKPDLDGFLVEAMEQAARAGQGEIVRRLGAVRGNEHCGDHEPSFLTRCYLQGLTAGPLLKALEKEARAAVDAPSRLADLGYDLLAGPCPSLGILAVRGMLPQVHPLDSWSLMETLLETRDRLGLPPDDPAEDTVLDRLEAEGGGDDTNEELEEAQARILETRDEVRRLRAQMRQQQAMLDEAQRRSKDRQREAESGSAQFSSSPAAAGEELQRRLTETRQALKHRHAERNELRREVRRLRQRLDVKDHAETSPDERRDEEREEGLLVPVEEQGEGVWPLRTPHFAPGFVASWSSLPRGVVQSALRLIGRLSAGHPEIRDTRRLRAVPDVWRVRVGIHHRLLVKLEPNSLTVLDLVPRQGLERAIRGLASRPQ